MGHRSPTTGSMPSSTTTETFVDTSGFYALLVRGDRWHDRATAVVADAARHRTRFVTTDYVLDEAATLLKARGHGRLLAAFFESVDSSAALRIEWTTSERFGAARALCLRHADKTWSLTDCLSFVIMRAQGLEAALTSDAHFAQAGFRVLLAE